MTHEVPSSAMSLWGLAWAGNCSKERERVPWKGSSALPGENEGGWQRFLLPAQTWPCHAGPREAEETVWGRGWQQRESLSFPPVRGREKAITVSEQQADTSSVPTVTDISFFCEINYLKITVHQEL